MHQAEDFTLVSPLLDFRGSFLIALLLGTLIGCGETKSPSTYTGSLDRTTEAVDRHNDEVDAMSEYDQDDDEEYEDEDDYYDDEYEEERSEAEEAALPQDFAEWTPEVFQTAKRNDATELTGAVQYLGSNNVGKPQIVSLLVSLLKVEQPQQASSDSTDEEEEGGYDSYEDEPIQVAPEVVSAIIQALSANNTKESLNVLKEMLLGNQAVPVDAQQMVTEVIRALSLQPNRAKESILYALLTKPEMIAAKLSEASADAGDAEEGRFGSSSTVDPDWLLDEVINEAGPSTSSDIRTALAKFLSKPDVTQETAQQIEQFLMEDDSRNSAAQILMFQNPHTSADVLEELEGRFLELSRQAMREVLALESSGVGGFGTENRFDEVDERPSSGRPSRSSRPSRQSRDGGDDGFNEPNGREAFEEAPPLSGLVMAKQLWTPKVVKVLQDRVPTGSSKEDIQSEAPALLACMPTAEARAALLEMFRQREDDGPDLWTNAGLFGDEIADPALLYTAKTMYHAPSKRNSRTRRRNDDDSGGSNDSPEDAWIRTLETYVENLCEQFNNVADPVSGDPTSDEGPDYPIRLHSRANVVAHYHLSLPDSSDEQLQSLPLAPLNVHYIRIEEEGRARTYLSGYKRQMSKPKENEVSGGLWLDGYDRRQNRSIDVRITSESDLGLTRSRTDRSDRSSRPVGPVVMTIEILTIGLGAPEATEAASTGS